MIGLTPGPASYSSLSLPLVTKCHFNVFELARSGVTHVQTMLPSWRRFLADEELGKKDGDHRLRPKQGPLWPLKKQWKPPRPRRFLLGIATLCLLCFLFKAIFTGLVTATERFSPSLSQARQKTGVPWPHLMSLSSAV
ncbi:uncharacterized protein ATNIH1004_001420 [Aspergillus tanneri]|uniref:Uncharacterized protein n=1 Tax=Aspergillus tanneri TaxID=1220188 RepID=A0A5M9N2H1_9EURO|nr:uncharacterized protein ATNIH1004_001420 [Aspergillus tanneri]KAA8652516.1 hypothetical protein ATNIH1004_001420 [Aspergillus tanneri]